MITANFLVFYFGRISTASGPFVIVQGLSLYSLAGGSRRQRCHRGGLKRGFELFCKRKYSFASRLIASEGGGAGLRSKSLEKQQMRKLSPPLTTTRVRNVKVQTSTNVAEILCHSFFCLPPFQPPTPLKQPE